MREHRLDRLVDEPQDLEVRRRVHVDLQAADPRPDGVEVGWWGETAAVGRRRAGEAAAARVLWGFGAEGVGGGGALWGGAGADDGGGESACDVEPEAAAEVAPVEERDG